MSQQIHRVKVLSGCSRHSSCDQKWSRITNGTYTFCLYSRNCRLQSIRAPSLAKSSNRAPGETTQRNTPSTSIVEVTSSRYKTILQHLIQLWDFLKYSELRNFSCVSLQQQKYTKGQMSMPYLFSWEISVIYTQVHVYLLLKQCSQNCSQMCH